MEKRKVLIWWMAGLISLIPAAILIIASGVALAAHLEPVTRATWAALVADDYARTMVALIVAGGIFAVAAIIAQAVAWLGAVLNVRLGADRRWFNVMLWVGIVGIVTIPLFGLGALILGSLMIAYFVGGPEGSASHPVPDRAMPAPPALQARPVIKGWLTWGTVAMATPGFFALLVSRATNSGGALHGMLWTPLALLTLCAVAAVCGLLAVTVAWWGAVFNAHRLADKQWFKLLMWSGIVADLTAPLFGLGALISLGVLIAYVVAAPDSMASLPPRQETPTASEHAPTDEVLVA